MGGRRLAILKMGQNQLDLGFLRITMGYMKTKKRKEPPRMDTHLVLRIPTRLKAAVEEAAAKDRRKLSDYVRIVLEDHLAGKKKRR